MTGSKTITVTFDCGKAGKVTWDIPRTFFSPAVPDNTLIKNMQTAFGASVNKVFHLLAALLAVADTALMRFGYETLDKRVAEIARELGRRMRR